MSNQELSSEDFIFDDDLGCTGACVERLGRNHFHVVPGHAPQHPEWANKINFTIKRHAQGNPLRLDVSFGGGNSMPFNEYSYSWSHDAIKWRPVHWENDTEDCSAGDSLLFPPFHQDTVHVGHQVPMSCPTMVRLVENYAGHPDAHLVRMGKSLEGRPLLRLRVTSRESPVPLDERPVLYFANQHPGEHNAQWRMIGMIDWLLGNSKSAGDLRHTHATHFVVMMSPDAPANGWYRVNAQGVDMNRSYRPEGASSCEQAHEAFVVQRDLEKIASTSPLRMVWGHHTWGGIVEPLIVPSPTTESNYGRWQDLRDLILSADVNGRVKPLRRRKPSSHEGSWTAGPHEQFGVTAVLCEGGGSHFLEKECRQAGEALMQGLAHYCTGSDCTDNSP
ncbi:MAG: M14 family zinc carboxypeptidase [Planctomycetota bacterium]